MAGVQGLGTRATAFGFDFEVREDLRRHGYGTSIMLAAEQVPRAGVVRVGLSVFGNNLGRRRSTSRWASPSP